MKIKHQWSEPWTGQDPSDEGCQRGTDSEGWLYYLVNGEWRKAGGQAGPSWERQEIAKLAARRAPSPAVERLVEAVETAEKGLDAISATDNYRPVEPYRDLLRAALAEYRGEGG